MELSESLKGLRLAQLSPGNQIKRHVERIIQIKQSRSMGICTLLHRFDEIERLKGIIMVSGGTIPKHKNIFLT